MRLRWPRNCNRFARGEKQSPIIGIENLSRLGSELNRPKLAKLGVKLLHADIRNESDLQIPTKDCRVTIAANLSCLTSKSGVLEADHG